MTLCDAYCEEKAVWHVVYGCLEGHVFDDVYCSTHGWETVEMIKKRELGCPVNPFHFVDSYLTCPTLDHPDIFDYYMTNWKSKWVTWDEP